MTRFHRLTAAAVLVGGLAAAGLAAAQPGPMMDGPMGRFRGIAFETIDTDGDGMLTRAELVARATERLGGADANGDGALDREEIVLAAPGPHGALIHLFSEDPAEAYADRLLAMMGATESGRVEVTVLGERRVNDLLAWIDTDRDAAVSLEEAEALQARRGGRHHGMDWDDDDGPGRGRGDG